MPTKGADGEAVLDDEQDIEQGAEANPRDMSLQVRQQQLNEQGGEKCIRGRWEDYAKVDPWRMGSNRHGVRVERGRGPRV